MATSASRSELDSGLTWVDVFGLSLLAGIGFTVSLLIGELAFGASHLEEHHVKIGVLAGSVLAAILGGLVLTARNRVYQRLIVVESVDLNEDGVPDVFRASP